MAKKTPFVERYAAAIATGAVLVLWEGRGDSAG